MTPEQRDRLEAIADRVGLDAAKQMVAVMRRIDDRRRQSEPLTGAPIRGKIPSACAGFPASRRQPT